MTACTAYFHEDFLAALYDRVVETTCSRDSQATVPDHEVVVVLVAHLVLSSKRSIVNEMLLVSIGITLRVEAEQHIYILTDILVRSVAIVRVQNRS